jgi:hypothetical protein
LAAAQMAVHLVGRVRGRRTRRVRLRSRDSAVHAIRRGRGGRPHAKHRHPVAHQYRYRADAVTEAICGVHVAISCPYRVYRGEATCGIHATIIRYR